MSVLVAQSKPGQSKDDWCTPEVVLERVRKVDRIGRIGLDPCTNPSNPTGAEGYCVAPGVSSNGENCFVDGLEQNWTHLAAGCLVYVNPPYSRGNLARWMAKCCQEADLGAQIIALVPADTSTRWWHNYASTADGVCFWQGRLRFVGAPGPAPFPSAVIYFGADPLRFRDCFDPVGNVWL